MKFFRDDGAAQQEMVAQALSECLAVVTAREKATSARLTHKKAAAKYRECAGIVNRTPSIDTLEISREDYLRARKDLSMVELAATEAELAFNDIQAELAHVTDAARARIRAAQLPSRRAAVKEIYTRLLQVRDANEALAAIDLETAAMLEQPMAKRAEVATPLATPSGSPQTSHHDHAPEGTRGDPFPGHDYSPGPPRSRTFGPGRHLWYSCRRDRASLPRVWPGHDGAEDLRLLRPVPSRQEPAELDPCQAGAAPGDPGAAGEYTGRDVPGEGG